MPQVDRPTLCLYLADLGGKNETGWKFVEDSAPPVQVLPKSSMTYQGVANGSTPSG
jgi:hypothetical protein